MRLLVNHSLTAEELASVYRRSGIRRPIDDLARMKRMLINANLVVSAWEKSVLVGVARCFTDYAWVCYLSDLAVDRSYQRSGIGRSLIECVRQHIGPQCQLVLLSAPETMGYYLRVGFQRANHAFIIRRTAS
jgi:ribosomal protein S18 acetylase RimI-like enzyme